MADQVVGQVSFILYKERQIILGHVEEGKKLLLTKDDYVQGNAFLEYKQECFIRQCLVLIPGYSWN